MYHSQFFSKTRAHPIVSCVSMLILLLLSFSSRSVAKKRASADFCAICWILVPSGNGTAFCNVLAIQPNIFLSVAHIFGEGWETRDSTKVKTFSIQNIAECGFEELNCADSIDVVWLNLPLDLSLIQVFNKNVKHWFNILGWFNRADFPLKMNEGDEVVIRGWIYESTNSHSHDITSFEKKGKITDIHYYEGDLALYFDTDIVIQPGSCGSGLFDQRTNELIGIVFAGVDGSARCLSFEMLSIFLSSLKP